MNVRIKKMCIYNGILFIMRTKEILQFGTTWMSLEGILPSKICQTEKDKKIYGITLYVESKKNQTYKRQRVE